MSVAKALLAEQDRRKKFVAAAEETMAGLFEAQVKAVKSKGKRKVMACGRQGGKTTTAIGAAVVAAAQNPGAVIPICERALHCAAANAFWKALQEFDARHQLGIEFRATVREAIMPNTARIQLYGVDTLELADKLRGEGYPLVIIDELGTFRSHVAEYLVDEVLPACMVAYDGTMMLLGTPGAHMDGFWYKVCTLDPSWERFHWTLLDNPRIGKKAHQHSREWREGYLAQLILDKGWLDREKWGEKSPVEIIQGCDNPKFRREFLGQWVSGTEEVMYTFRRDRNTIPALPRFDPERPWQYGLSIDLGFNDPTAFIITATRKRDPNVYVVYCWQQTQLTPTSIAAQIDRLQAQYGRFKFIVADTGGGGKMAVEEMNNRFGYGIIPAKKTGKVTFVEFMNGDFQNGRLQLVTAACQDLISDYLNLPWNDDRTDAADGFADHLADAALYGYREWYTYNRLGEVAPAEHGTPEWLAQEDANMELLGDELHATDNPDTLDVDPDFDADFPEG